MFSFIAHVSTQHLESLGIPIAKAREEDKKSKAEHELSLLRKQLPKLANQAKKQQKGVESLEKRGVVRLFARVGGNLDDKVIKSKQQAELAVEATQTARGNIETQEAVVRSLAQNLTLIYTDEAALNEAYAHEKALFKHVFAGPSGKGDDYEKSLQHEVFSLKSGVSKAQHARKEHELACTHMQQAVTLCGQAVQNLQQAQRLCAADLAMNMRNNNGGAMGMINDMKKHRVLRDGATALAQSSQYVLQAKLILPQIQPLDPALIRTMSPFMDRAFDGVVIDLVIARQVKQSLQRTESAYAQLNQGLGWVEGLTKQVREKADALKGNRNARKKELKRHRIRLIENAGTAPVPAPNMHGFDVKTTHVAPTAPYDPFADPMFSNTNTNPFVPPPSPTPPHYPQGYPLSAPNSPFPPYGNAPPPFYDGQTKLFPY